MFWVSSTNWENTGCSKVIGTRSWKAKGWPQGIARPLTTCQSRNIEGVAAEEGFCGEFLFTNFSRAIWTVSPSLIRREDEGGAVPVTQLVKVAVSKMIDAYSDGMAPQWQRLMPARKRECYWTQLAPFDLQVWGFHIRYAGQSVLVAHDVWTKSCRGARKEEAHLEAVGMRLWCEFWGHLNIATEGVWRGYGLQDQNLESNRWLAEMMLWYLPKSRVR